ncbi:MAG: UDP-2,3-diacylglucosamine diphosphatase LpxI [Candidatus Omnitrophica bacterium]|nr:UDP-2,3-diacylglucosamine diphosphatase LpxI [Candidatus Omnitrophota bacterium]
MALPLTIGLIAGNGQFPLLFAKAAKYKGIRVVSAAVKGDTSLLIHFVSDSVEWFSPGELKKLFGYFRAAQVTHVLMAGQVHPRNLFRTDMPVDDDFRAIFEALSDRRCDTIFGAIADRLKKEGMELLDSTLLLTDHLAPRGTLTRHAPTAAQIADIEFGRGIAKEMGGLDIGQTVVVQGKAILAIEALEGTDQCILRGACIAREGAVVVKASKPKQDNRFDVPVVGPRTIMTMQKGQASCLAIEAGKTLLLDRDQMVKLANRSGISIVAF